ncbi:hypothetical protein AK812_SmicGene32287 [Symbiodinium microadriaticum]|uniref:Uncharacterized protein n=1 Tax=Symbiodinium microadriaticum TaxID=2951 RepID=A0A1Q9CUK0_SYMMI|nr:hypothetical protein AK812_SmicGene32287 [Symbiodinium microadriaticum]
MVGVGNEQAATRAELLRKIEVSQSSNDECMTGRSFVFNLKTIEISHDRRFSAMQPFASRNAFRAGPIGLQSSAALAGQLNEVVRLVQVIASGTEHLGEKLCDEAFPAL